MSFDIICPIDFHQALDIKSRYCTFCGEALCHPCPNCSKLLPTRAFQSPPIQRCPGCDAPLWQCKSCHSLGMPGNPDCENPNCERGSRLPAESICSQLGGDSGRAGAYHIQGGPTTHPFLQSAPRFVRLSIPGEIKGIAAGTGRFWILSSNPGKLFSVTVPAEFSETLPAPTSSPFAGVPVAESADPIAVAADRLYLLSSAGALIQTPNAPAQSFSGNFVAQCLHSRGWLLVENTPHGAVIHRRSLQGDTLHAPVPFPERKAFPGWTLPVADDTAAYLTDDRGQAWRFPWDGGVHSSLGTPLGVLTTLLLTDGHLYVLPVNDGSVAGLSIDLATQYTQVLAQVKRSALAAAAARTTQASQLWAGAESAQRLACLDQLAPASAPKYAPGSVDQVTQLCTVQGPDEATVVIAAFKSNSGCSVRGWRCEPPFLGSGMFEAFLPNAPSGPRLLVHDRWLGVWCAAPQGSELILYYLV